MHGAQVFAVAILVLVAGIAAGVGLAVLRDGLAARRMGTRLPAERWRRR
jgi:hypothetical protein